MNRPRWQKARILRNNSWPEVNGRTLWVRCEPPQITNGISMRTRRRRSPHLSFVINIRPIYGSCSVLDANHLELLPEFADDVPEPTWEEFRAQEG